MKVKRQTYYQKKKNPKKRGRKPGQGNSYCKLPFCSYCGIHIHSGNRIAWDLRTGKPKSVCRDCNRDLGVIKSYRNKSDEEIIERIKWHEHQIQLLNVALTG